MNLEKLFETEARQEFDDVNAIRSSGIRSFLDEWVVTGMLGRGSFGNVYEIIKPQDGISPQRCALKVCQIVTPEDADIRRQEIETQQLLTGNANAVQIEDFALIHREPPRVSYLLIRMELLSPMPKEGLSEREVIKMGIDICSVLEKCAAMEPKLIHCDIKPANILLSPDGRYKLADFGTAKTLQSTMTYTGNRGTPLYMAPEVAAYTGYDSRCDIFSLGYTMLTMLNGGRHPYQDAGEGVDILREMYSPGKLPPIRGVSSGLMKILRKMCEPGLADRYSRAGAIRHDLERFVHKKAEAEKKALYDTERRIELARQKATGQQIKNLDLAESRLKKARQELAAAESTSGTPKSRLEELDRSVKHAALVQRFVADGQTFEDACRKASEEQNKPVSFTTGAKRRRLPIFAVGALVLIALLGAVFAGLYAGWEPSAEAGSSGKTESYRDFVFELTADEQGYILKDYTGKAVCSPRIPAEFNFKPVLHIGDKSFYDADNILKVTIPDTVTSIGDSAFEGCDRLSSVEMGESVIFIADNAFEDCRSLDTEPSLPTAKPTAKPTATTTTSARPKDVVLHHERFTLELTKDGQGYIITDYAETSDISSETVVIPDEINSVPVLHIGEDAFSGCRLSSVTIGDNVETIGESAFSGCTGMSELTIGKNVTYIADSAFGFCVSLGNVRFTSMKYFKDYDFRLTADGQGYTLKKYNGSGFSNILIPEEIEGLPVLHIADRAFYNHDEIGSVRIGYNVKTIGRSAFENCGQLRTVDFSYNSINIDKSAFASCPKKEFIHYENFIFEPINSEDGYTLTKYDGNGSGVITIPDTVNGQPVTTIDLYAFYDAAGITTVNIGNNVTDIKSAAFEHCLDLKTVNMSDSVTGIMPNAFHNCPQLGYVPLPDELSYFSEDVFFNNLSETGSEYPEEYVFYNGFRLRSINGGNAYAVASYQYVDAMIYVTGEALPTTVYVPENYNGRPITEIGQGAFRNCPKLKDIPTVN